jgi:hypothetical protein
MPTRVAPLSPDAIEELRASFGAIFADGQCYAFATALHLGTGWPLVGLMDGEVIRHAGVRGENGLIYDVRSAFTDEDFGRDYLSPPYVIRDLSEADLWDTYPIDDEAISQSRRLAEVLYPALPWQDSLEARMFAFGSALEKLSRKHRIWVRAAYPTARPHLSLGDGEETGYELFYTADGHGLTFDRSYDT